MRKFRYNDCPDNCPTLCTFRRGFSACRTTSPQRGDRKDFHPLNGDLAKLAKARSDTRVARTLEYRPGSIRGPVRLSFETSGAWRHALPVEESHGRSRSDPSRIPFFQRAHIPSPAFPDISPCYVYEPGRRLSDGRERRESNVFVIRLWQSRRCTVIVHAHAARLRSPPN